MSKKDYYLEEYKKLVGQTITGIVRTPPDDIGVVFGLRYGDDKAGGVAWILCDPEGNGPGFLEIEPNHKERA